MARLMHPRGVVIRSLLASLMLAVGLLAAAWSGAAGVPATGHGMSRAAGAPQVASAVRLDCHCHGDGGCCCRGAVGISTGHGATWIAAAALANAAVVGGTVYRISPVNAPLGRTSEPLLHPPSV